ncbi:MAG TPA: hypothetical protein VJ921_08300, partial [Vicinamibacteria bacterium]|nr:hypothetical protein [Vicinamibacteria bacterium]
VQLESLYVRFAPGLHLVPRIIATGGGLSVSLPDREDAPPFITMNEFEVELGIFGLLADPIRIRSLTLDELAIQIPPKQPDESEGGSSKEEPPPVFVIDRLVADGAVLRILPRNPEKDPLQFDLHELRVRSAGVSEPMAFEALLDNPKPPGRIQTRGRFGPLLLRDPGASQVSGEYVFEHADLSVFKGIAGILRSEGRFDGVLGRIEVSGNTETPDFQLTSVGNPVPLKTEFEAVVDGTNGDTFLTPVDALLGESRFRTSGGVAKLPGEKGKTVCVDAENEEGRIEDFLRLAMKSERPFMTGGVRFKSMILIPPGDVDVVEKLVLDGEFAIDSATFPERAVQEKVEKLSDVGTAEKSEAGDAVSSLRQERVLSDIRGGFALSKGVMTLSSLSFTVPGASVTLEGTYALRRQEIDFHGELRLDSKLSDTTTGIKSFLLKMLDPLFQKDDAGAVIPIRISGTADKPSFGVEMGRVLTRKEVTAAPTGGSELAKSIRSCAGVLGSSAELSEETRGTE